MLTDIKPKPGLSNAARSIRQYNSAPPINEEDKATFVEVKPEPSPESQFRGLWKKKKPNFKTVNPSYWRSANPLFSSDDDSDDERVELDYDTFNSFVHLNSTDASERRIRFVRDNTTRRQIHHPSIDPLAESGDESDANYMRIYVRLSVRDRVAPETLDRRARSRIVTDSSDDDLNEPASSSGGSGNANDEPAAHSSASPSMECDNEGEQQPERKNESQPDGFNHGTTDEDEEIAENESSNSNTSAPPAKLARRE